MKPSSPKAKSKANSIVEVTAIHAEQEDEDFTIPAQKPFKEFTVFARTVEPTWKVSEI